MLIEGLLIGVAAVVNLGGLRFIYKRLAKQEEIIEPDEKWFTIAVAKCLDKFSDSKEPYTIGYTLKVSNRGKRRIDMFATPQSQSEHLIRHGKKLDMYLLYLEPWESGFLSIDDISATSPKWLQVVPNKDLLKLK